MNSYQLSSRTTRAVLAAMGLVLAVGCGYRPDLPPTEQVSGVVTLDGAPVPNAEVQFIPDKSKTEGPPAAGFTDSQGRYELFTAGVKGAVVGHHKVRVEARAEPKDETDTLPELLTPAKYGNPDSSGFAFEVKADDDNTFNLPLVSTE